MASTGGGQSALTWLAVLQRIDRRLYRVEQYVCGLSLFIMLMATAASVLVRNFQLNVPNVGEIGLAALVPLTLIGGAMCTYLGAHIAVELMQVVSSRVVRGLSEVATALATVAFACVYAYSGWILVGEFRATGDKLLDLGTPLWLLALCFPIGMGLMLWHSLARISAAAATVSGHNATRESTA